MGSAAVCAYSQEDLQEVFEGKYKELNKESSRWTVYSGSNMSPRPGSVSADAGLHGEGFVCPSLLWGEVVGRGSICTKPMLWGSLVARPVPPCPPVPQLPHAAPNPLSPQCYMGPSSDRALTFMKDHFLMDGKVSPTQGRPLLVKTGVTYTRIAVDETRGVSGVTYRVMFLATSGFMWGDTQGTCSPLLPFPWPLERR